MCHRIKYKNKLHERKVATVVKGCLPNKIQGKISIAMVERQARMDYISHFGSQQTTKGNLSF